MLIFAEIKGSIFALGVGAALLSLAIILRYPLWGLYLAIASTAVLKSPELPLVREKLTAVEFFMVFTWIALAVKGVRGSPVEMDPSLKTNRALAYGFAGWILLSGLWHNFIGGSLQASSLLETLNYVYGLLIYLTILFMVRDWRTWRNCLWAWVAGAVVAAGVGALATLTRTPTWAMDGFTGRVSSTLRFENQVPSFLLPILPVVVILFAYAKRSYKERVGLLILLGAMFLTSVGAGSRTGIGMLILSVLGVLCVWIYEGRTKQVKFSLVGTLGMALAGGMVLYFVVALAAFDGDYRLGKTPAWQRPAAMLTNWVSGKGKLDSTRPEQLAKVGANWERYAILGTGPKMAGWKLRMEEIHNTYAGILMETGVPSLLLFLAWLGHTAYMPLRNLKREPMGYQRALILALLAGFVVALFYQLFCFGLRQRNIWMITALLALAPALIERSRRRYLLARKAQRSVVQALDDPGRSAFPERGIEPTLQKEVKG